MGKSNIDWKSTSDKTIISIIGEYIKHARVNQNKTQEKVAEMAGISRWTVSQIENGEPMSLLTLIQILRALDLLELLSIFKIDTQPSPLEIAKLERDKRQRASSKKEKKNENKSEW